MTQTEANSDLKRCSQCAEWIQKRANFCRFCNSGLSTEQFYPCPYCAEMVRNEARICKCCKSDLSPIIPIENIVESNGEADSLAQTAKNLKLIKEKEKAIMQQLKNELDTTDLIPETKRQKVRNRLREIVDSDKESLSMVEKGIILQNVLDEIFGFGPLGELMRDATINDISVYGPKEIYVHKNGKLHKSSTLFENNIHLFQTVERIVEVCGKKLDKNSSVLNHLLPSGDWVTIVKHPDDADEIFIRIKSKADKNSI